jgi:hypothetical protein
MTNWKAVEALPPQPPPPKKKPNKTDARGKERMRAETKIR